MCFSAHARIQEPSMFVQDCSINSNEPFIAPIEDVKFYFSMPLQLFDGAHAEITCEGAAIAEAVSMEIENDPQNTRCPGALILHFDKQNLPKGKRYEICVNRGAVGWTECYNDIQIINVEFTWSFTVPDFLPEDYRTEDWVPVDDNDHIVLISWHCYMEAAENAKFILYREDDKIGEYPISVERQDWGYSYISPVFNEYFTFDKGVRYKLVLPAGSLHSLYRDDIGNNEIAINLLGNYTDPATPFSYIWCSRYTDHSDILGEVTFTYDRSISVAPDAKVQLWEGAECDTLVKEVTPWIRTDVNCWLLVADFGGIHLDSENGYVLVVPDGTVISDNETGIVSARSDFKIIGGSAGINKAAVNNEEDAPVYNLQGIKVETLIPGNIYIKNGKKFIHR